MTNHISRRDFFNKLGKGMVLLGAADIGIPLLVGPGKKRPNILIIVADDLRPELGCYSAHHIKSPHIDWLASQGVLFKKAYIQQAVCAPSRASFLTGCRPNTTGVDYPYTDWFRTVFLKSYPDMQTYFYRNGYYTTTFGKVHHEPSDHPSCSEPHYSSKKPLWVAENHQHDGPKPCVEMIVKPDSAYQDGDLTDNAIQRLRIASRKKQPFFLAVGYKKPHLPYVCPEKYSDLYERSKIKLSPVPQFPEGSPPYSHRGKRYRDENGKWILLKNAAPFKKRYIQNPGGLTPEFRRELRHGYYACVSFIDAQVGRLIEEIKKLGMWDDTVVALWGDHGYHLGDHNYWTKGNNCEFDTRIPLIFRVPGRKTAGQKTDALVEAVDIFPTFLEVCGFPIPDYMEGTSFMPLVENPQQQWKKAVFSQYPRGPRGAPWYKEGYTMRTHDYRYTEWRNNNGKVLAKEFYDYSTDPLEAKNLIEEKKYKNLIREHETLLKEGWKKALPSGVINKSANPRGDDSEYFKKYLKKQARKKEKKN